MRTISCDVTACGNIIPEHKATSVQITTDAGKVGSMLRYDLCPDCLGKFWSDLTPRFEKRSTGCQQGSVAAAPLEGVLAGR